tara:strand:- start:52 stop:309 length:258 start_codon:yes stop_codon:yes gene_type:complete
MPPADRDDEDEEEEEEEEEEAPAVLTETISSIRGSNSLLSHTFACVKKIRSVWQFVMEGEPSSLCINCVTLEFSPRSPPAEDIHE